VLSHVIFINAKLEKNRSIFVVSYLQNAIDLFFLVIFNKLLAQHLILQNPMPLPAHKNRVSL
jgi:hypothetical protein